MTATTKVYTMREMVEAIQLYAEFHNVEIDAVELSRNYEDGKVIGFRLSSGQNGNDEKYGIWN